MIAAFREQTINKCGVDAVGRKSSLGDPLWGILIVIEACGPERKIEVGDDRIEREITADCPRDIVSNRRGADTAFGADHRNNTAHRLCVWRREKGAHRSPNVAGPDPRP